MIALVPTTLPGGLVTESATRPSQLPARMPLESGTLAFAGAERSEAWNMASPSNRAGAGSGEVVGIFLAAKIIQRLAVLARSEPCRLDSRAI